MESLDFSNKKESMEPRKDEFDTALEHFLEAFSDMPLESMTEGQKQIAEMAKSYYMEKYPNRTLH